jgi:hypothetical protein
MDTSTRRGRGSAPPTPLSQTRTITLPLSRSPARADTWFRERADAFLAVQHTPAPDAQETSDPGAGLRPLSPVVAVVDARPDSALADRPEQVRPRPTLGRLHSAESGCVAPCFPGPRRWRRDVLDRPQWRQTLSVGSRADDGGTPTSATSMSSYFCCLRRRRASHSRGGQDARRCRRRADRHASQRARSPRARREMGAGAILLRARLQASQRHPIASTAEGA